MPNVFLSPSTQEYNLYVTDGRSEEYYMNLIADAMEPYLLASGVNFSRNDPNLTVSSSVQLSNAGNYDFHLALHSNAAGADSAGQFRGSYAFYYPGSAPGEAMAQLIAANMSTIYPVRNRIFVEANGNLYELRNTRAPSVLVEVAFHDNYEDAAWITNNIENIARVLVLSITQYFGLPFVLPGTVQRAIVTTEGFSVNLRAEPNFSAQVLATAPNGANLIVTGQSNDWYVVDYNGVVGYIYSGYIEFVD